MVLRLGILMTCDDLQRHLQLLHIARFAISSTKPNTKTELVFRNRENTG